MTPVSLRRTSRNARPELEGLEDRKLLYATLGSTWTYGSRITYSFAPDGTNIGGKTSALFSSMNNRGFTNAQWQAAFQKAAAAWSASAKINLVLVPDNGAAFGSSGDQQGDSDFGDIRIGATQLSNSVLATCFLPPDANGGTLAGDMVFNTNQAWQINNDYDLQTVAIHEFGHALGLDHSSYSTADMFANYNGMKQSLTSDDVAGIQDVFGPRSADQFDAGAGNNTYTTATNLNSYLNANSQAQIPGLDITSTTDADWFAVNAPAGTSGTFTVTMQSSNLSSLSTKLLVYNASLVGLASASVANAFGSTVTISIGGVAPGQKFYIKAMAANGGSTGVGAYGLNINFGTGTMSPIAPPNTTVPSAPDQGGGSSNESDKSHGRGDSTVRVGSLSAQGDSLSVDSHYEFARQLIDGVWDIDVTFADANHGAKVRDLIAKAKAAAGTDIGDDVRAAAIQALDQYLEEWDN